MIPLTNTPRTHLVFLMSPPTYYFLLRSLQLLQHLAHLLTFQRQYLKMVYFLLLFLCLFLWSFRIMLGRPPLHMHQVSRHLVGLMLFGWLGKRSYYILIHLNRFYVSLLKLSVLLLLIYLGSYVTHTHLQTQAISLLYDFLIFRIQYTISELIKIMVVTTQPCVWPLSSMIWLRLVYTIISNSVSKLQLK